MLTPLCNADKDMELSSEFVDDIESFVGYTSFLHISPILVTRKSSELIVLASESECRSTRTWPRRVIGADDDRDDLLSEGIKNAVDGFVVSRHCTTCSTFMLVKGTVAIQIDNARNLVGDLLMGIPL